MRKIKTGRIYALDLDENFSYVYFFLSAEETQSTHIFPSGEKAEQSQLSRVAAMVVAFSENVISYNIPFRVESKTKYIYKGDNCSEN